MYLDVFELSFFPLISSLTQTVCLYIPVLPVFPIDLFLSSDPAHCFVDLLSSVPIWKPGAPNCAPCFNAGKSPSAECIALCLFIMKSFSIAHCYPFVCSSCGALQAIQVSEVLRWPVLGCVFGVTVGFCRLVLHSHKWRNEKQDGNQHRKQLSLVNKSIFAPW